ncbi:MAG: ammonium transporter [Candidatus Cyclobacteriaceae bacterium M3_2C_046]
MQNNLLFKILVPGFFFFMISTESRAASGTQNAISITQYDIDSLWVLLAAALVFLMQAGFKSLEVGLVRRNHGSTVAMKNVIDWSIGSLIFFFIGFGIMFGSSFFGLFGTSFFIPMDFDQAGASHLGPVFFMFQLAFVGTALTIVSGAMSERTGFIPYLVATIFIAVIIYPVFGHWAWGSLFIQGNMGWLESVGFIDFAGSTVVHSVGAWVSLAGLLLLGPRIGRFDESGQPRQMKPNSIAYAVLGLFLLWFGWWGFNGGSTLSFSNKVGYIILNTNLAGAAAGMAAYFHALIFQQKKSIYEKLIGGALTGLVAITASAHIQNPFTAILIGLIAGIVHNLSFELLLKYKIDDAVGAIPIHGFGGITGTLLVVISPEIISQGLNGMLIQFFIQLLGTGVCFVWTFGMGYIIFKGLKKMTGLRVSPQEEREGILLYPQLQREDEEIDEAELAALLSSMEAQVAEDMTDKDMINQENKA